jgi:hypothetical protein
VEKIKKYLYQRNEVIFAYLYGSYAKGNENKLSDIDIAIYIDKSKKPESGTFGYRSELITELQSFVDKDIDLIILNEVTNILAYNVLKDGKLLFTKSYEKRINFHEKVMKTYLDFLPTRNIQDQYLKESIKNGKYGRG